MEFGDISAKNKLNFEYKNYAIIFFDKINNFSLLNLGIIYLVIINLLSNGIILT